MKYSDLISFNPIEDVIQLTTADDANRAKEYVKSYVMSDTMAANLKSPVLDQLQMDEVVDNKGVLVVGNYGTGKSHLMSVISSIAKDADNLQYLQNKNFAKEMECIAGKFEVLRIRQMRNSLAHRAVRCSMMKIICAMLRCSLKSKTKLPVAFFLLLPAELFPCRTSSMC